MTARREVPALGDNFAWVHSELAEIKSRLALVHNAAEQSRNLATDAAEKALSLRTRIEQAETQAPAIGHILEELRSIRDHTARAAEEINSLRQSRDEIERRVLAESDRERQDRNEAGKRFTDLQRQVDAWQERVTGYEETNRRNLEVASQMQVRLESFTGELKDVDARQARDRTTISRIDQEVSRLSSTIGALHREDDTAKERFHSLTERLARLEGDLEVLRGQIGRIDRIDDRLELVQAERSRHGERITELTLEADRINDTMGGYLERAALVDARIASYQDDIRALDQRLTETREQWVAYLRGVSGMETEFRKRQLIAIEKELRDIRTRGLSLAEE